MTLYMITTALSQYNKGGDPDMVKWTSRQPERIYQMSVEGEDIAAYLRIKAGKSKAGRGMYARRRPFVHMKFNGVDGALPVILNEVPMVSAVADGLLSIEGSPEYGAATSAISWPGFRISFLNLRVQNRELKVQRYSLWTLDSQLGLSDQEFSS